MSIGSLVVWVCGVTVLIVVTVLVAATVRPPRENALAITIMRPILLMVAVCVCLKL